MSLKPEPIQPVPIETARVAKAAFPKGNLCITLRVRLGTIFRDEDFVDLFPHDGQPALPLWRLALVTILQFRESLLETASIIALLHHNPNTPVNILGKGFYRDFGCCLTSVFTSNLAIPF